MVGGWSLVGKDNLLGLYSLPLLKNMQKGDGLIGIWKQGFSLKRHGYREVFKMPLSNDNFNLKHLAAIISVVGLLCVMIFGFYNIVSKKADKSEVTRSEGRSTVQILTVKNDLKNNGIIPRSENSSKISWAAYG